MALGLIVQAGGMRALLLPLIRRGRGGIRRGA